MADARGQAVVAFANDWGTDPTSKHHLMRLLAGRRDVLWVEASGMRRPTATSAADLRRIMLKLRKMSGGTRPGAVGGLPVHRREEVLPPAGRQVPIGGRGVPGGEEQLLHV